jgi:hypothetical protein
MPLLNKVLFTLLFLGGCSSTPPAEESEVMGRRTLTEDDREIPAPVRPAAPTSFD